MYFGKLYYAGIFPFLTNKKEIKPRSNIFKIDSVVSTKLSPDSSSIEQLRRNSPFVEIDDEKESYIFRYRITYFSTPIIQKTINFNTIFKNEIIA